MLQHHDPRSTNRRPSLHPPCAARRRRRRDRARAAAPPRTRHPQEGAPGEPRFPRLYPSLAPEEPELDQRRDEDPPPGPPIAESPSQLGDVPEVLPVEADDEGR